MTYEGELITQLQTAMTNEQNYNMVEYIGSIETVARKKLEMYTNLLRSCSEFRQKFGEEPDDVSNR